MNLVLLRDHEIVDEGRAVLGADRARHLIEVLGVEVGRRLRVGREDEGFGEAEVLSLAGGLVELAFRLSDDLSPPPNLDLILALPRPKVLRRLLEHAPGLGFRRLVLVRSAQVDRSYFSSPQLEPEAIEEALTRGMEQACVLQRPQVTLEPLFRPYVEDRLPSEVEGRPAAVLHPRLQAEPLGSFGSRGGTIAVGPERGWNDFEVERLVAAGFEARPLGPRVLRVEAAVIWAAARASLPSS